MIKQERTSKELPEKFLPLFPFPATLPVLLEGGRAGIPPSLSHSPVSSAQDK